MHVDCNFQLNFEDYSNDMPISVNYGFGKNGILNTIKKRTSQFSTIHAVIFAFNSHLIRILCGLSKLFTRILTHAKNLDWW